MTRPAWLDDPKIRAAIDAAVDAAPPLTSEQQDLLRRIGFASHKGAPVALTTAATPSKVRADTHVAVVNGAGGPAVSVAVGEVSTRNASSATADSAPAARPPAPHTKKARAARTAPAPDIAAS